MGQCTSRTVIRSGGERWEDCVVSSSERAGCLAVMKEYRSRFYIARRCIIMLLCWQKYGKY
ncbi:hypothetical protein SLEP1_g51351 [Rubroshorea leprosula]|uniref:Uncharacterized protein n=1 Tax=Rubroshorea leprosula TaxID=152421 RepID=A0AAV5M669_9ROSI|nr:hypothetical protein SLEP1_g51351 [Rubroshorea leprosula]